MDKTVEIYLDRKILYYFRPEKVLSLSLLFLLIAFIIAPITIQNTLDVESVLYLTLCILFFFIGTSFVKSKKYYPVTITVSKIALKKIYNRTLILGCIGLIFRYFDLLIYRDLSFSNSIVENHEFGTETGGSIYSIIASLLMYFAFIPITINLICGQLNSKKQKIFSFILFILIPISTLMFGSRFGLITPMSYLVLLLISSGKLKVKLSAKFIIISVSTIIIFLTVISSLFLKRLDEMNITGIGSVSGVTGGYADKVPVSDSYQKLMQKYEGTFIFPYLFAYANLTQYTTHAVIEFPGVKNNIDEKGIEPMYGKATFFVFYKFIEKVFQLDYSVTDEMAKANSRNGIWSTFFLYWYLDFRWFGIILMAVLGFLFKKIWAIVYKKLNLLYLPIVLYLPIIVFLIPQLNYLAGISCYVLTSLACLPIFFKLPNLKVTRQE